MQTYFVVQSFEKTRKGALVASSPVEAQGEQQAMRLAERLSRGCAGVVAFSRSGDPATGEFDDATILVCYGAVPGLDKDVPEPVAC